MGNGLAAVSDDVGDHLQGSSARPGPELSFLSGLGGFLSDDKGSAPYFLLQADYARTVNIAVAGNSGVGKSLLVNTIRGTRPEDPTWAPVGVTETTREPVWYEFPGDSSVRLWDMEGAGSTCSWDNYTGNAGLRYFDVVLLLCSSRLTESDVEIVRELESQNVPCLFVRTKLDEDIKNNQHDLDMSPQETEESIRSDLRLSGITRPYLINARVPGKHDFPRLIKDIVKRLEILERQEGPNDGQASLENEVAPVLPSPRLPAASSSAASSTASPSTNGAKAPVTSTQRHPLIWSLPDGKHIGRVEALCEDGGHWIWTEDDGVRELLEAELGWLAATVTRKFGGTPEHYYSLRPDGAWEMRIKTGLSVIGAPLSGKDYTSSIITPNPEESTPHSQVANGKKYVGTKRHYEEGGRLVTEISGTAENAKTFITEPFLSRMHRFVVDDMYWLVLENVTEGKSGIRRFKRYPFYRITNETGKEVTMKTYPVEALFGSPSTTATIEPGATRLVECHRGDVRVEQVVFSLTNRLQYTVSEVEPFETFFLRTDLFS
mmetsp:Transcript_106375/g.317953  ORF Transcript_106375/g.317953 Transcript_106375/m.317953 type:complete len:547 (-) Transcript_106375:108-1748(-)